MDDRSRKKVTKDTVFKESTTVKAAWVEESERADALADFMKDQGFSQSSIDKHVGMLAKGSTASIFGSGSIWMIVAFIFIALSAVLGIIAIKRK